MIRHQRNTHEPERRRDCIKGWWERYGLIIAAIGGTLAISGSCWAFVLRQADPHIDSRIDLKIISVNARIDSQNKKISEYGDCLKEISEDLKFNKQMMLQHLTAGEKMRASREVFFQEHHYYPDQKD